MREDLRKATEFKALSDEYRCRYAATKDPSVIAEFHRKSFLAVQEAWVKNEIIRWYMQLDFESIEALGLSGGENRAQNRFIMAVRRLMVFDRVNDLVSKGSTKVRAFASIAKNFLGEQCSQGTIKNAYYAAMKDSNQPEIRIEETETEIITQCGPTRVHLSSFRGYGFWEDRKPKKK